MMVSSCKLVVMFVSVVEVQSVDQKLLKTKLTVPFSKGWFLFTFHFSLFMISHCSFLLLRRAYSARYYAMDLQGIRVTVTINILNICKLMENHLITKNTQCLHHLLSCTYSHWTYLIYIFTWPSYYVYYIICASMYKNCYAFVEMLLYWLVLLHTPLDIFYSTKIDIAVSSLCNAWC